MSAVLDSLTYTDERIRAINELNGLAYYKFKPRPNQPEKYDQQAAFVDSRTKGVSFLLGGNGAGTTECAMHKLAQFVLNKQPPPRKDAPFWIIGTSYEQIMKAGWKEKLEGHGHIPPCEIDYERITWYDGKKGLPYSVPLKPWPTSRGGHPNKNWTLEFKSNEQGRQALQAEALGGFCFVEQFPWGHLEEVIRGCREYNFPGSKFCEFTPVDPALSYPLEEMTQKNKFPPGWEIFYANTRCAMEAGHIDKDWYDEFFSLIPESMRETRETGKFATFAGAIYSKFNHAIHLVGDDLMDFPPNIIHRRGIDWGSGPSNPFCNLWAYKRGQQWFVYDEYYSAQPVTIIEHLCEVSRRSAMWGWKPGRIQFGAAYADPSGVNEIRTASQFDVYGPKDEKGQSLFGPISISSAAHNVLRGIEYVQWLLQPAPELGGQCRLYIHQDRCPNLARQMRTYRWKTASEKGINPQDARPEPLKKDDHAVDALRYLVFTDASRSGGTPEQYDRNFDARGHGVHAAGGQAKKAATYGVAG